MRTDILLLTIFGIICILISYGWGYIIGWKRANSKHVKEYYQKLINHQIALYHYTNGETKETKGDTNAEL